MTVRQLIAFLETQDPDTEIVWDASQIEDLENLPALILNSIRIDKVD